MAAQGQAQGLLVVSASLHRRDVLLNRSRRRCAPPRLEERLGGVGPEPVEPLPRQAERRRVLVLAAGGGRGGAVGAPAPLDVLGESRWDRDFALAELAARERGYQVLDRPPMVLRGEY